MGTSMGMSLDCGRRPEHPDGTRVKSPADWQVQDKNHLFDGSHTNHFRVNKPEHEEQSTHNLVWRPRQWKRGNELISVCVQDGGRECTLFVSHPFRSEWTAVNIGNRSLEKHELHKHDVTVLNFKNIFDTGNLWYSGVLSHLFKVQ